MLKASGFSPSGTLPLRRIAGRGIVAFTLPGIALAGIALTMLAGHSQAQSAQPPAQQGQPSSNPAPSADAAQTAAPAAPPAPPAVATQAAPPAANPNSAPAGGITEDELKRLLVGKQLYLRGGYLDDNLSFNEHGVLTGHSPQGSYTLSGVAIDKIHISKHKVELEGQRFGLHFLGALASEDPTTATDRVPITPKKKVLRITIDREAVISPKKLKGKAAKTSPALGKTPAAAAGSAPGAAPVSSDSSVASSDTAPGTAEPSQADADQVKADIAAAPAAERPADPASVTTTTSPAHASAVLKDAIDRIFSVGLDDRMKAAMPDFWKLYYQAAAAHADYRPKDASVLRQSAVDRKARLISLFEPASNEYAQSHGVAGIALYHVVIGADGKPGEIAVARPIGFGLDENAAASIRKASFEPAIKGGKPVSVLLDLIVEFHIYSGLTGAGSKNAPPTPEAKPQTDAADKPASPLVLPGPYSVPHQ
jgi:outer membrane biosynthesis protein TonB